jgi:hypothetical protein
MRSFKPHPSLSLVGGLALAGALVGSGHLKEDVNNVYEPAPPAEIVAQSGLHFEEVSEALGVRFDHKYFPGPPLYLATMFPAVSIVDLDEDGFMDIYFSSGQGNDTPNPFYKNDAGKGFKDIAKSLKIRDLNASEPSSFSVFADFDRDGKTDVLVVKWGCH